MIILISQALKKLDSVILFKIVVIGNQSKFSYNNMDNVLQDDYSPLFIKSSLFNITYDFLSKSIIHRLKNSELEESSFFYTAFV